MNEAVAPLDEYKKAWNEYRYVHKMEPEQVKERQDFFLLLAGEKLWGDFLYEIKKIERGTHRNSGPPQHSHTQPLS